MGLEGDDVGVWGLDPEIDPEEKRKSDAIDERLRKDRIKQIQNGCSVLILGESSKHANDSRHHAALSFAKVLAEAADGGDENDQVDKMREKMLGDSMCDIEVSGTLDDGSIIQVTSFPSNKKDKTSKIKLAIADPSVLVYVANPLCEEKESVAKSLTKALGHLLFSCHSLGTLQQTAVCIVMSNCNALRSKLSDHKEDDEFLAKLKKNFMSIRDDSSVEEILLGISSEFEKAAQSFNVPEVRIVHVEEKLSPDENSKSTNASDLVAQQMLSIVKNIQAERLEAVNNADMNCVVSNTKPRTVENIQASPLAMLQIQQEAESKRAKLASRAKETAGMMDNPMTKLALFGVFVAILTLMILQALQEEPEE